MTTAQAIAMEQATMMDYRGNERLSRRDRIDMEKQIGRFAAECGPVRTYKMKDLGIFDRPVGVLPN